MGSQQFGIDSERMLEYAEQIKEVVKFDQIQLSIVIGGGNIFRGISGEKMGIERATGDYMGMLATVINGLALQATLEELGLYTRLVSAIEMQKVAEPYIRRRVVRHLEKNRVIIFAAGTGNPFFTTDTAAALRAIEINADIILKATRVDGIYTADPEKFPDATRYTNISFREALNKDLKVMDAAAFALCRENNVPIIVFDMNKKGNLRKVIQGEKIGTLVSK